MEGDLLENSIKINAEFVANEIKSSKPILNEAVYKNELTIIPAYYELSTGRVKFL